MRTVGLTGGIATGKSTVAGLLRDRGVEVVDSDLLAREVVEPGGEALREIASRFGEGVVGPEGSLDRAALAAIVFADASARADLEAITHPRIAALSAQRIAAAQERGAGLLVVDIPLLYEAQRESAFAGVMVVCAPATLQLRRMVERDGFTEDEARQRIAAQLPIEEKRRRATWVIDNSGTLAQTERQVEEWLLQMRA